MSAGAARAGLARLLIAGLIAGAGCVATDPPPAGPIERLDELAARRSQRVAELGGAARVTGEEARRVRGVWHRTEATGALDTAAWAVEVNGAGGRMALWTDGVAAAPLVRVGEGLVAVAGDRTLELDADGYPVLDSAGILDREALVRLWALAALADEDHAAPRPPADLDAWGGWIGHYRLVDRGDRDRTIVLHERAGRPAFEIDALVLAFGDWNGEGFTLDDNPLGLRAIEVRPAEGDAPAALELGDTSWARADVGAEEGETFRIDPVAPVDTLREAALAAEPPAEPGELLAPDLVELTAIEPGIRLDVRYATANNFMGVPFYRQARAFLQRPAAEAVAEVHRRLASHGLGLLVHDGYRPWYVTRMFWDATPEGLREFVADPSQGSRHNRGAAVDLTLFDLASGEPVRMTGGYDEFSVRSYPDYAGGTSPQRWHRELLRDLMEEAGFTVYEAEWWHFDFGGWERYPLLDRTFEELESGGRLEGHEPA